VCVAHEILRKGFGSGDYLERAEINSLGVIWKTNGVDIPKDCVSRTHKLGI
jgi:hypothetical protein